MNRKDIAYPNAGTSQIVCRLPGNQPVQMRPLRPEPKRNVYPTNWASACVIWAAGTTPACRHTGCP